MKLALDSYFVKVGIHTSHSVFSLSPHVSLTLHATYLPTSSVSPSENKKRKEQGFVRWRLLYFTLSVDFTKGPIDTNLLSLSKNKEKD